MIVCVFDSAYAPCEVKRALLGNGWNKKISHLLGHGTRRATRVLIYGMPKLAQLCFPIEPNGPAVNVS